MTQQADISVLIACRNASTTVLETIESIHRQSLPVREVLVGDDASTDGTFQLVSSLSMQDLNIRCFHSATNLGPASIRNMLLEQSSCEWVAILDADDVWKPNRIEHLWPFRYQSDVISDDLAFWIEGKRETGSVCVSHSFRPDTESPLRLEEMLGYDLGLLHPMIRRGFLLDRGIRYRDGMFHAEDMDLYVRLLLAGARWLHSPVIGYKYRKHAGSLTKNWQVGVTRGRESLERIRNMGGIRNSPDLIRMIDHLISVKNDLETVYAVRDDFRESRYLSGISRGIRTSVLAAMFRLSRAWKR